MHARQPALIAVPLILASLIALTPATHAQPARIPILYSTDLLHPHDDPDDHFDLATLLALTEFDLRAIILDLGERQKQRSGRVPVAQLLHLTGRKVPCAPGLPRPLASPDDPVRDVPAADQAGVELLIASLRQSREPVILFTTGSLRDVCAAFNREPDLLRRKVRRLYINAGNAAAADLEWNVRLDPHAFVGVMRSGLPIYWCPCLPMGHRHSTYWQFRQRDVLTTAPRPLQNFFIYALQRTVPDELDPLASLTMDLRPWHRLVWDMPRNMWCTAPLLHAAGRELIRDGDHWTAAAPTPSQTPASPPPRSSPHEPTPQTRPAAVFTFIPARVHLEPDGHTRLDPHSGPITVQIFQVNDLPQYAPAMRDALSSLFAHFPFPTPARSSPAPAP